MSARRDLLLQGGCGSMDEGAGVLLVTHGL